MKKNNIKSLMKLSAMFASAIMAITAANLRGWAYEVTSEDTNTKDASAAADYAEDKTGDTDYNIMIDAFQTASYA